VKSAADIFSMFLYSGEFAVASTWAFAPVAILSRIITATKIFFIIEWLKVDCLVNDK
jgi:hypothetical protein